ncbi:MAG: hypothetical protein Q7J14_00285 [Candidatus Magasanikbacteria bacterium]|nr:hypothetical protein [Candidatus Magasanikbacteria bacterium]
MTKFNILGVHVGNRVKTSEAVQKVLTDFGCSIKLRIGLHEADEKKCSVNGLIILQIFGGDKEAQKIKKQLAKISGVKVKEMVF